MVSIVASVFHLCRISDRGQAVYFKNSVFGDKTQSGLFPSTLPLQVSVTNGGLNLYWILVSLLPDRTTPSLVSFSLEGPQQDLWAQKNFGYGAQSTVSWFRVVQGFLGGFFALWSAKGFQGNRLNWCFAVELFIWLCKMQLSQKIQLANAFFIWCGTTVL